MKKAENNTKQETVFGRFVRLACVIPTATAVTAGLFVTMNHLVDPGDIQVSEVEFRALERITPPEIELAPLDGGPHPVKPLDTPVPPAAQTVRVADSADITWDISPMNEPKLDFIVERQLPMPDRPNVIDRPIAEPIRAPLPDFPGPAAIRGISGACDVRFDINPRGEPYNVSAECTDRVFEREAERATRKALFAAPVKNGIPVGQKNLVYPIVFQLNE